MPKYGYARSAQKDGLDEQIKQLTETGCEEIHCDVISGSSKEREGFSNLIKLLKEGDSLIVTSLDRMSWYLAENEIIIRDLLRNGVIVHILNIGIIEDSPINKMPFSILSAFAEFEKNTRYERLLEGKTKAKLNPNFKEGRPPIYSKKELDYAMKLKETHSFTELAELTGISLATLKRESAKRKKQVTE